jgi:hypothetical protein
MISYVDDVLFLTIPERIAKICFDKLKNRMREEVRAHPYAEDI